MRSLRGGRIRCSRSRSFVARSLSLSGGRIIEGAVERVKVHRGADGRRGARCVVKAVLAGEIDARVSDWEWLAMSELWEGQGRLLKPLRWSATETEFHVCADLPALFARLRRASYASMNASNCGMVGSLPVAPSGLK